MDSIFIFSISFTYSCLLLATLFIAIEASGEVANQHPYTYDTHTPKGPHNWANLDTEWKVCNNGKSQSPIDLNDEIAVVERGLGNLKTTYTPALAKVVNRGHDIMMSWTGNAGGVIINDIEYKLQQCHWHIPTEHTLNGKKLAMELHIVHKDTNGHLAVVAVQYQLGEPDHFLAKFLETIKSMSDQVDKETPVGTIDPSDVHIDNGNYYRYIGSLTTPPCTEGVVWTIIQKVKTVSNDQISAMKIAVQDEFENNARPTQPLNERTLYINAP